MHQDTHRSTSPPTIALKRISPMRRPRTTIRMPPQPRRRSAIPERRPHPLGKRPGGGARPPLQRPSTGGSQPTTGTNGPPGPLRPEDVMLAPHPVPDNNTTPRRMNT